MDEEKVHALAREGGIADTKENNKAAVSKSTKSKRETFLRQTLEAMKAKMDALENSVNQLELEEWEEAELDCDFASALGTNVEDDWQQSNARENANTKNAAVVRHLGYGGMQMMPAGYQGEATFSANYGDPMMAFQGLNLHESFQFGKAVGAAGRLEQEIQALREDRDKQTQALREDRDKERQYTLDILDKVAQGNNGPNVPGNGSGADLEEKMDRLSGLLEKNIAVMTAAARGKE